MRMLAQDALFPEWRITEAVGNAWDGFEEASEVVFDAVSTFLDDTLVTAVQWVLLEPPAIVVIVALALVAWWAKGWKLGLGTLVAFWAMEAIGYFENTMESLAIVLVAAAVAITIGVPLGILASRSGPASKILRPILDFMQTMPSFVYLMLAVAVVGVGAAGGVLASVIFAMPPAVRLTELGIRQVDEEVVEAARAFGAKPGEILRQVQLPLAMPTIMAGVNQVIMLSLSMVVIAGLAGGGGIAGDVVTGVVRLDFGLGIVAGLCVVALAVYLDRVTSAIGDDDAATTA
jgi:ABC-type proline/glycine betaine transport system permease subunit